MTIVGMIILFQSEDLAKNLLQFDEIVFIIRNKVSHIDDMMY